jgi:heme-degrading monooxygenase HmoA
MYTRRTRFPLKPNTNDRAVDIMQKYGKVLHDMPGHVSTVMFLDEDASMTITTWDTLEHAEAAASSRDAAQQDLVDILAGGPSTVITETVVHDAR